MSQGPMSNSPSKGGTMRSQMPTSYQSPFGGQNYRTQTGPSKGGQSRPPMSIQPYPMPSPGGKGGSYQRPPTPFGYGQPTFSPQQFSGYGQPSNIFSFNNPHYQPYMPQVYDSGQAGQSPDIGNNPMTPQPEVMAQPVDQQVAVQTEPAQQPVINAIPPERQSRIVDPKTAFTPPGGYNPLMPFFGGKGGTRTAGGDIMSRYMPPEGYSRQTPEDYNPDEIRVFDPYGSGGAFYGQPRPAFPDPTQPQGPQGTVQGAPPVNLGQPGMSLQEQNYLSQFSNADRQRLGAQSVDGRGAGDFGPVSGQLPTNMTTGDMSSGLGSLFNQDELMKRLQENARSAYMNRPQTIGYYR